jgi:hypothetical protein
MNPVFSGKIEQGKVLLDNPNRYLVQISRLEGQRIEVVLRKQKSTRSINQNNYYWGVVLELLSDNGNTPDEWHEMCRQMFLKSFKTVNNKEIEFARSTTKLNTTEFEEYLEKIRRWAATELNCFIPLPNEVEAA